MLFGLNIHKLLQWSYLVEAPEFNFRYDRQVLFYLIAHVPSFSFDHIKGKSYEY